MGKICRECIPCHARTYRNPQTVWTCLFGVDFEETDPTKCRGALLLVNLVLENVYLEAMKHSLRTSALAELRGRFNHLRMNSKLPPAITVIPVIFDRRESVKKALLSVTDEEYVSYIRVTGVAQILDQSC